MSNHSFYLDTILLVFETIGGLSNWKVLNLES